MARYSDADLVSAVAGAHSWRGVLRSLGIPDSSAGASRAARRQADRLGLDYSHFTGNRRWSDEALRDAVAQSFTWDDVLRRLGLSPGSSTSTVRGHALRLGLDTSRLGRSPCPSGSPVGQPMLRHLRRAGSLIAATWFELCGAQVAWPLEPCRYDLLVWRSGAAERVQVKTTTHRDHNSWSVQLRCTDSGSGSYDPDDVDQFFIVDGDLACYLIPLPVVGGRRGLSLNAYQDFKLPPLTLA